MFGIKKHLQTSGGKLEKVWGDWTWTEEAYPSGKLTCWKSPKLYKRSLTHFQKMSLARWFWAFFFKVFCLVKWGKTNAFSSIGKMKLIKRQIFSNLSNSRFRSLIGWITLKKNAQNQRAKLIFSKWVNLLLYNFGFFQQNFENLKMNKLAKEERRLDLKNRIWRLKFGKNALWKLALLKGWLSFLWGLVEALKSGKTSLLEVEFILRRKRRRWAYSIFSFGTLQAPTPSNFGRKRRIFF